MFRNKQVSYTSVKRITKEGFYHYFLVPEQEKETEQLIPYKKMTALYLGRVVEMVMRQDRLTKFLLIRFWCSAGRRTESVITVVWYLNRRSGRLLFVTFRQGFRFTAHLMTSPSIPMILWVIPWQMPNTTGTAENGFHIRMN